jgi:hypothetical protein
MGAQERKREKRIRDSVIERDKLYCCYCDVPLTKDTVTMEHIVPHSKHGTYNKTNLTVACAYCNNKRGSKPFFDYCKQFNFSEIKIRKYKSLYFNNLKIKILNLAKEKCLNNIEAVPNDLINAACRILKINTISFLDYEKIYNLDIKFNELVNRKKIKYNFELLIRLIEENAC